jgi:uncharacterized membrane protein
MMWYDGGGVQWWGWLLGAFMMVAFWGLIIWGIWYLVTSSTRNDSKPAASAGAKEILDMRLARGEIDPGDYDRLRKLIDAPTGQGPSESHKVSVTTGS